MKKVVVIIGQTASGKSALAVKIGKKFNGEVISADSRQVYKGINIGTGKITPAEMRDVPHHLLDVVNPKTQFSVMRYKQMAEKKIKEITTKGKLPIICGGTGFYIDAVTKGMILPHVPPNKKLRKELSQKSVDDLFSMLKKLDKKRAESIDAKNKIRLIRAIEIVKSIGGVPQIVHTPPKYEFIKIGLKLPEETLKRKIKFRLRGQLRSGMAIELYNLRKQGVPWKRFIELGFDQKYVALYLQKKITQKEMMKLLFDGNWQYARRQMTWFKRDPEIKWFDPREYKQILNYLKEGLA